MLLDCRGHPLHTRALSITFAQRADGRLDVHGELLDLRKRGFVPVGGDLQPSGIIHHMLLDGIVDPQAAVLDSVRAAQPSVAFEPTAVTGGESCRDPIAAVEALAGASLDSTFPRRVGDAIGGPRGCNHILTLAHLLGSTAAWALERDHALHGTAVARAPGQRVYRRDLIVGGHEAPDNVLVLGMQSTDLHLRPAPAVGSPMQRFAGAHEVRALATVDLRTFTISSVEAAERRRDRETLRDATWQMRDDVATALVGERLGAGITRIVLDRFAAPADRPLQDGLLMLAPTLVQCMAALSEARAMGNAAKPTVIGMGGLVDSCYMWRADGALARRRAADGAAAPSRPGT